MTTGLLRALDDTGDTRIEWDSARPDEVAAARATFERLHDGKKYRAYKVNGDNREIIHRFDPDAEAIVMAPQTVGG